MPAEQSAASVPAPRFVIITGMSGAGRSYAIKCLEDLGYFCVDPDTRPGHLVFNRTVALKDAWAKIEKKTEKK